MNKKVIVLGIIIILVVIGAISLLGNHNGTTAGTAPVVVNQTQTASSSSLVSASSTVPLMQSTGSLFSQYKYFSKAYEIFPTLGTSTTKVLGAFGYTKESLGNNTYRFTLTNSAEGYNGQSVVVSGNQSVYFIEPATGDDSASEDSITIDDSLVAVDSQGYILK